MDATPHGLLVATSREAQKLLTDLLSECSPEFVFTMHEGLAALLRSRYSNVIVSYHFAESQMFKFAQSVRQMQPSARVICVKDAGRPLRSDTRSGVDAALRQLGSEGVLDLTAGEIPESFHRVFNEILADCRAARPRR